MTLREELVDLVVKHRLRELRAVTETGTITVSEPPIWERNLTYTGPDYGLNVEEKEVSL